MLQRFASACLVGCVAIAVAVAIAALTQLVTAQRFYLILSVWCAVPCIWGLWAMLAPKSWVPQRLPLWGAFLGIIAGVLAAFVLNMPARVFDLRFSALARGIAVIIMMALYYFLWMIIRATYRKLTGTRSLAAHQ